MPTEASTELKLAVNLASLSRMRNRFQHARSPPCRHQPSSRARPVPASGSPAGRGRPTAADPDVVAAVQGAGD